MGGNFLHGFQVAALTQGRIIVKGFHMPQVPQGACDDVSRDDGSSSRVVVPPSLVPSYHRAPVALEGFPNRRPVRFRAYCSDMWAYCSDMWALCFDADNCDAKFWVTEESLDALIGEMLAAREQYRMEREAKALMVEALGSLVCPVPDSDDDVPW